METIKIKLDLGKIAYSSKNAVNLCELTLELTFKDNAINYSTLQPILKENAIRLSICGNIWNSSRTDIDCGGQCIDTIADYFKGNAKIQRIKQIWEQYHLNDLQAGTKKQVDAVDKWRKEINLTGYAYREECEYLQSIGLLIDNGIKWGAQWLFMPVPEPTINEIKELFS